MKNFTKILLITFLGLVTIFSAGCGVEGCTDPNAINYNPDATKNCCCEYRMTGLMELDISEKVGNDDFALNQQYQLDGVPMEFTHTSMYLTNFTMLTDTGEVLIPDSYILYNANDGSITLSDAPTGDYNGLKIFLGIDSVTNYTTLPAEYAPGHPLSTQTPNMHWSWNTGYIYLRFDGNVDTTMPADNTYDDGLTFHIGTQPFLTTLEFDKQFSITEGSTTNLQMEIDYAKFFDGINLRKDHLTHTGDYMELANEFKANMTKPFTLK